MLKTVAKGQRDGFGARRFVFDYDFYRNIERNKLIIGFAQTLHPSPKNFQRGTDD